VNDKHNIRLSYNRAANPIAASDIYFDLPVEVLNEFESWVLGAKNPYTFGANPTVDWFIPMIPNSAPSSGFPLAFAYGTVNQQGAFDEAIAEIKSNSALADLIELIPIIKAVISDSAITPQGINPVVTIDDNGRPLEAKDGKGNLLSFLDSYEIGYKGVIGDRFSFGVDVYHYRRKGGASFQLITPLAVLPNLGTNLGQEIQTNSEPLLTQSLINNTELDSATAESIAKMIAEFLGVVYTNAGDALSAQPLGVVPIVENAGNGLPRVTLGYLSNDPNVVSEDWGAEFNFKFFLTENLTTRGNYTWFRLDPDNPEGRSFPNNKVRFGIDYDTKVGFYGTLNYQWDQSFTSNNIVFPGDVDEKSLFDVTLGYDLTENLKLELSGINVFNNEFRALPGFPRIGRTITGRIVVDF